MQMRNALDVQLQKRCWCITEVPLVRSHILPGGDITRFSCGSGARPQLFAVNWEVLSPHKALYCTVSTTNVLGWPLKYIEHHLSDRLKVFQA
eukprot:2150407-Amphidinium_carterae.2